MWECTALFFNNKETVSQRDSLSIMYLCTFICLCMYYFKKHNIIRLAKEKYNLVSIDKWVDYYKGVYMKIGNKILSLVLVLTIDYIIHLEGASGKWLK